MADGKWTQDKKTSHPCPKVGLGWETGIGTPRLVWEMGGYTMKEASDDDEVVNSIWQNQKRVNEIEISRMRIGMAGLVFVQGGGAFLDNTKLHLQWIPLGSQDGI